MLQIAFGSLCGATLAGTVLLLTSDDSSSDGPVAKSRRRMSRGRTLLVPMPLGQRAAGGGRSSTRRRSSLAILSRLSISSAAPRRASIRPAGLSSSQLSTSTLAAVDLKLKRALPELGSRAWAVMDHRGTGFVEIASMVALYARLGSDSEEAAEAWQELIRDAIGVGSAENVATHRLTSAQWRAYVDRLVLSATTPGEIFDLHDELTSIVGDLRRASILGHLLGGSGGAGGKIALTDELRRRASTISDKIEEEVLPLAERFFETIAEEEGAEGRGASGGDGELSIQARKMSRVEFLDAIERQADECTSAADVEALERRLRGAR